MPQRCFFSLMGVKMSVCRNGCVSVCLSINVQGAILNRFGLNLNPICISKLSRGTFFDFRNFDFLHLFWAILENFKVILFKIVIDQDQFFEKRKKVFLHLVQGSVYEISGLYRFSFGQRASHKETRTQIFTSENENVSYRLLASRDFENCRSLQKKNHQIVQLFPIYRNTKPKIFNI